MIADDAVHRAYAHLRWLHRAFLRIRRHPKPVGTYAAMGFGSPDRATINVWIRIKVGRDFVADYGIEACTDGCLARGKGAAADHNVQGTCAPYE